MKRTRSLARRVEASDYGEPAADLPSELTRPMLEALEDFTSLAQLGYDEDTSMLSLLKEADAATSDFLDQGLVGSDSNDADNDDDDDGAIIRYLRIASVEEPRRQRPSSSRGSPSPATGGSCR